MKKPMMKTKFKLPFAYPEKKKKYHTNFTPQTSTIIFDYRKDGSVGIHDDFVKVPLILPLFLPHNQPRQRKMDPMRIAI